MPSDIRAWLNGHVNLETGPSSGVQGELRDSLGLPQRVAAPTLDRISYLVDLLGSPQTAYPVVHVTGTNGKTSTSRMTAALLAARGLSVGLYTSPHLQRVEERLAWNGQPIDDEGLDAVLSEIALVEDQLDELPSYFEILTAAAFTWFAEVAVDVAVVEVGLGGTWDATNVVDAAVAVVTNIGVDHVEYLGPTRHGIAKEKAGIIKDGSAVVLGETDPEITPVFFEGARPSSVVRREHDFGVRSNVMAHNGRLVTLYSSGRDYEDLFLPFHGAHQADNAACAVAAAEGFFGGEPFDPDVVQEALAGLELPGRLEIVGRHPLVILDGAHNAEGAKALRAALREEFPSDARTLVVGILREKEPHEMLEALGAVECERLVACSPPSLRALDAQRLADAAKNVGLPSGAVEIAETVPEAVARALAVTPEDGQVVVTGSLYTVGAARAVLVND
ncbi:MAG: dihydrofolate synthase [Actinobacteria bacterium]|nr:dihydrofolate synthase [Actinomycetota bacterium]